MMHLEYPLQSFFLAIPLEGEAQTFFTEACEKLLPYANCLTFQNPSTAHLTLMYWKSVLPLEHEGIDAQAKKIASRSTSFSLQFIDVSTFGFRGSDSILYFVPNFSPELAILKKKCPWSEGRLFVPHLTIARIQHPARFAVVKKEVFKLLSPFRISSQSTKMRTYAEVAGKKQTPLTDYDFGYSSSC